MLLAETMGLMGRGAELVAESSAAVVVLIAPPGFGCTELLSELATTSTDARRLRADSALSRLRADRNDLDASLLLVGDVDRLSPSDQRALGEAVEAVADPDVRVVLWSRTRPDLPLGRWQVDGVAEVVLLDRFLLDASTLRAELGLDGDALERALVSTGGWPSAVTLLAQHLMRAPLDSALRAATAEHVRFVAEEVLGILSEPEQRLLGSLTVLDRLDDTSLARFTADPSTPARVRSIAERTQLLGADPGRPTWHPDVRAALQQELERVEPGSLPTRHRAAAEALSNDRSQLRTQLQHLVKAEAWEDVLVLVAQRWREFIEPDRLDGLVAVITSMPRELVTHDATLSLGAGAILLTWGDAATAAEFLEADCIRSDPAATATAAALRAHATWWSTAPEQALDLVEFAEEVLDSRPGVELLPLLGFETVTSGRSMLVVSRARALAMTGRLADAALLFGSLPRLDRDDPVAESVSAWSTKALVDALTGDLVSATDACDMALTLAQDGGWHSSVWVAPTYLARALVAHVSGMSADVWSDVAAALDTATRARAWGLARMAAAVGALVGSVDRVPSLGDATSPARVPFADRVISTFRARHALRCGQEEQAAALLGIAEPIELALAPWTEVAIAVHGRGAAASRLNALSLPTTAAGRVDHLLARSLLEPDNTELERQVVSVASGLGLRGALRSGAPSLAPPVPGSTSSTSSTSTSASANDMGGPGAVDHLDLSQREQQVLELLDSPLSLAEIGHELFLSANTVKWHLRHLYRKLGVHNRLDAVGRAQRLGLIE